MEFPKHRASEKSSEEVVADRIEHAIGRIDGAFARASDHLQHAIYEAAVAREDEVLAAQLLDVEPGVLPPAELLLYIKETYPGDEKIVLHRMEEISKEYESQYDRECKDHLKTIRRKAFMRGFLSFGGAPAPRTYSIDLPPEPPLRAWAPQPDDTEQE